MAGKFLTLEEAARRLGVAVEEINRLVDRKELFPMRDGATLKFKVDEIERVAADLAAGGSGQGSGLGLDLDLDLSPAGSGPSAGSGAGELVFGDTDDDDSIFGDDAGDLATGPKTSIPEAAADAAPSGTFDVDDLGLDSILAASGIDPAASGTKLGVPDSGLSLDSGTIELDLGEPSAIGSGGLAAGSGGLDIDLSDIGGGPAPSGTGSSISGALDSGLSLENDTLELPGFDVGLQAEGLASAESGIDAFGGSGIGGEAFDLGGDSPGLDDDGSIIAAPDESGDSSFITSAFNDASSTSFVGDGPGHAIPAGEEFKDIHYKAEEEFTLWQLVGLICCSVLMLLGGLVVFDIVKTTQAPQGTPYSSLLLDGLNSLFGW